jgi:hypothetical protein
MAERVGFEPTVPCGITGFQDQLLKPLGHLSVLDTFSIIAKSINGCQLKKYSTILNHNYDLLMIPHRVNCIHSILMKEK